MTEYGSRGKAGLFNPSRKTPRRNVPTYKPRKRGLWKKVGSLKAFPKNEGQ